MKKLRTTQSRLEAEVKKNEKLQTDNKQLRAENERLRNFIEEGS